MSKDLTKNKCVLEWSAKQQATHIQLLETALEANIKNVFELRGRNRVDYIPIFEGSWQECLDLGVLMVQRKWKEAEKLLFKYENNKNKRSTNNT